MILYIRQAVDFAATGNSLAYKTMDGHDERYVADLPQLSARGMLTGTATRVLGDQWCEPNAERELARAMLRRSPLMPEDYQGNVRAVIDVQGTLEEVNGYYPYGGLLGGGTVGGNQGVQPYKYGAKELDRQNGLDWYDSQARMYDPVLGRTPTMDSKAEDYYSISPYAWCVGNPIKFVDTNGKWIKGSNGKRIKLNKKDRVWSKNTSEDIQRIGDAMMMTEHGMQKLDDMLNSPYPISLQLNKTDIIKYDNGDVKLGGTTPWLIRDKKGKAIDFKRVEIVIYLKAIQEYGSNDSRYKGLSEDEIIGANAVHESTHGTEKEANNNFNESDGQAEDKAKQSEEEYIKQLNEKKSKEEVQQ